MKLQDEISATNQRHWEKMVKDGCEFTIPWLDLDISLLHQWINGDLQNLPDWLNDMYPSSVFVDVKSKDVLCLASGGGQQSAVFGLLGARVTVLDLTEGQLEGDKTAAAHYGYELTTIQGDMRDISCLSDESFDLVYQGNSMAWIPDVREVYTGVARVLRTGGIYRMEFTHPATEFVDYNSWNGEAYLINKPYTERINRREDGAIEFRHYMNDIFNGLLNLGFSIYQVEDAPRFFQQNGEAQPGSWDHSLLFLGGFAIVAKKKDINDNRKKEK